jgi:uncharacterized protein
MNHPPITTSALRFRHALVLLALASLNGCDSDARTTLPGASTTPAPPTATTHRAHTDAVAGSAHPLVTAARRQVGVTTEYDPAYRKLAYPNGDVPLTTGVCADVIVRALRVQNLDLQKLVHEDMTAAFAAYPRKWNLSAPDRNIDHRRVLNLMTYFKRRGAELPVTQRPEDYAPGDIVSWDLSGHGLTHIGILSDRNSPAGAPLVLHNIGQGVQESDILFRYAIIGHYRLPTAVAR